MNHDSALAVADLEHAAPMTASGLARTRVMVVDDDPMIRQMIADYLGDFDIRVSALDSGRNVAAVLERESIDLVILDVKLQGDEDGMQIARRLRAQWDLPIIMLTGRRDEADRVMALELAADDYLTKPFSPRELLARIRAVLRRAKSQAATAGSVPKARVFRFAGWELNVGLRRLLSPDATTIACTNSEFNLLMAFLSAPQRVLSREQLLDLSRVYNDEVYDRSVDVQVGRLRKKLQPGAARALIRTERGAGYVFTATVDVLR